MAKRQDKLPKQAGEIQRKSEAIVRRMKEAASQAAAARAGGTGREAKRKRDGK